MGLFAVGRRAAANTSKPTRSGPTPPVPVQFEAIAEALAADSSVQVPCVVTGHELARDGVDLGTALEGLRETYAAVAGTDPSFASVEALSLAWSEETLSYLHQLSCEDPLTGLASQAHLRARLDEVYREAEVVGTSPAQTHALVVVDLPLLAHASDRFSRALWLVQAAEGVRDVFSGGETICTIGATRVVVLARRDAGLGSALAAVREQVGSGGGPTVPVAGSISGPATGGPRIWSEALPGSAQSAAALLDELSRR